MIIISRNLVVAVLLISVASTLAAEPVSLAGTWRFALDREDKGVEEQWFNRELDGSIALPGALQNQGFGDDITVDTQWTGGSGVETWLEQPRYEKYRQPGNIKIPFFLQPDKHYVGAAWYQRDIDIPANWQNRRVVLTLERAHWETRVWLDDRMIGGNDSLSTPHVYDLGSGLAPGRHRLSIRVDNHMMVNVGDRAHSVSDETQGNWNGLIGKLTLSTTSPVWIDDVQIYPDVSNKTTRVAVVIGNASGKAGKGTLAIASVSQPVKWTAKGGSAELRIAFGSETPLWDEFNPSLQSLNVKLSGDHADDERTVAVGLREIGTKNQQFVVNGRPTFFRGTLECCIFPLTGYPPTDVESWKRIIRICQDYGLNHIRFHSWCPPDEAFEAADELGMYLSVEIAAWTSVGDGQPIDQWLYDESERVLKTYGNHPSFVMMPYGNEPSGANKDRWLGDWVNHWKQTDPRRLYTSAGGWPLIAENEFHINSNGLRGPSGWRGKDYRKTIERSKGKHVKVDRIDVPIMVHEMGQWCAYPDFDEIPKFTGPLKPNNLAIIRNSLAEHGMLDQAHDFLMASGRLQLLCYKEEIEAALRTPGIGGVQLLDLHDFPGQGTSLIGVLDAFWDPKPYVTAEAYRRFYNTTVPLARLMRSTWTSDETLTAEVEVAHFGAKPLKARPYWKIVNSDGQSVAHGDWPELTIPIGQGNQIGIISLPLDKLSAPRKYKLVVGLADTPFENDWNFWVYPSDLAAPPTDVLIAASFDESVRQRLDEGGNVLLASDQLGESNPKLTFAPVFWNRFMWQARPEQTLGLLCNPTHPALARFPTEYYQEWQWDDIVSSARGIVLDGLPRELKPIVQPIDDWNSNRKLGLVFECKAGKGRLLVCAADLSTDLEHRLAARQLRTSLLAYAAGDAFSPTVEVKLDELAAIFQTE